MLTTQASHFLPYVKALAEGRTVQARRKGDNAWFAVNDRIGEWFTDVDFSRYEFRIAEPPKLRPWKQDEIPLGAWIRHVDSPAVVRVIIEVCSDGSFFSGRGCYSIHNSLVAWEHSIDQGKTWHPCGVLE